MLRGFDIFSHSDANALFLGVTFVIFGSLPVRSSSQMRVTLVRARVQKSHARSADKTVLSLLLFTVRVFALHYQLAQSSALFLPLYLAPANIFAIESAGEINGVYGGVCGGLRTGYGAA